MLSVRSFAFLAATILLAVVTPFVALTASLASPPNQETMNFTVEGRLTRHTGSKLTLSAEGNMIFHVVYNEKTEIARKDGSAGSAEDLRVGARIRVDGELTEAGEIIAQKIRVLPDSTGEKQ